MLPHVTDVDEAMGPDAPLIHDWVFTKGMKPKPEKPSNISARTEFDMAMSMPRLLRPTW